MCASQRTSVMQGVNSIDKKINEGLTMNKCMEGRMGTYMWVIVLAFCFKCSRQFHVKLVIPLRRKTKR